MELLNKDTKPCPSCGTMIFKISGCDQLWCPDCQTAFSWNTLRIETGIIHNPHYYEFQRKQNGGVAPRNHGDIPCGGLPDAYTFRNILARLGITQINITKFSSIMQVINHIRQVELRNHVAGDPTVATRSLRIKFLLNEISENELKYSLQQNEKAREKKIDFSNIYQMFCEVSSDIFRQVMAHDRIPVSGMISFVSDQLVIIENLVKYFNENLKKVGKVYKCVYPGISLEYSWVHNYETYLKKIKK